MKPKDEFFWIQLAAIVAIIAVIGLGGCGTSVGNGAVSSSLPSQVSVDAK